MIVILIGNMMVANLVAFLPTFVDSNNWEKGSNGLSTKLSDNDISWIIASFSAA